MSPAVRTSMASILKRFGAKMLIALASQPAMRGAAIREVQAQVDEAHSKDIILEEMGAVCGASYRHQYHAQYTGPITSWREQSEAVGHRKLSNGCMAARREYEAFVEARTR